MEPKTVGILEDDTKLIDNIRTYIGKTNKYKLVLSESKYEDVLKKKSVVNLDYLLLDLHLKDTFGLEVIGDLFQRFGNPKIVIITGDTSEELLYSAMRKGAASYLSKPFSLQSIINTFENVTQYGSHLDTQNTTLLINRIQRNAKLSHLKTKYNLTDREVEVLNIIRKGSSYKEAAQTLGISFHTVNDYMKSAYKKLDVNTLKELLTKYIY